MIIVIMGPTASGKSTFVEQIHSYFNNPLIVNADAFQIYKDMDIGTAKIEKNDPLRESYSLLDVVSPNQTYSSRDYQKDFRNSVDKAIKDKRDVIVVGGTGLYVKAALYDYDFVDKKEDNGNSFDSANLSNEELYCLLQKGDPISASKIHINNRKRVIRALEILAETGKTKSSIIDSQNHKLIYSDVYFFFVNPNREELYSKINERVDKMFEKGLVEEVKTLLNKYCLSITAKQAIGYQEVIEYLQGNLSLEAAKETIKKRTRNYAKRQITFFKHQFEAKEYTSFDDLKIEIEEWRNINDKR